MLLISLYKCVTFNQTRSATTQQYMHIYVYNIYMYIYIYIYMLTYTCYTHVIAYRPTPWYRCICIC